MKTLWHGGVIYTMKAEEESVEAVLVSSGKIEKVGRYEELKREADRQRAGPNYRISDAAEARMPPCNLGKLKCYAACRNYKRYARPGRRRNRTGL